MISDNTFIKNTIFLGETSFWPTNRVEHDIWRGQHRISPNSGESNGKRVSRNVLLLAKIPLVIKESGKANAILHW